MIDLVLVLLIPAAYYLGRFTQWTEDAKLAMGSGCARCKPGACSHRR